jgi:hypothetical protein
MIPAVVVVQIALYLGIAWVVLKGYRRTRNVGFLVLGCGVLIWPLVSALLGMGTRLMIDRVLRGETVTVWPFSLLAQRQLTFGYLIVLTTYGKGVIQSGLILLGILALGKVSNPPISSMSATVEQ